MDIYIMRHGTTVWNEVGVVQGRCHNRLSKSGKELVQAKAEEFKNTHIDVIVASPLMRTMQTANIVNAYHNVKIIKDDRLLEVDQGVFVRRHKNTLTPEEKEIRKRRDKGYGMETWEECYQRMRDFANNIKKDYGMYNSILIVTHNATATFLASVLNNTTIDYTKGYWYEFDNAEIKHFVI